MEYLCYSTFLKSLLMIITLWVIKKVVLDEEIHTYTIKFKRFKTEFNAKLLSSVF